MWFLWVLLTDDLSIKVACTHAHKHIHTCAYSHTQRKMLGKNQQKENIWCCDSWRTYIALYLHIMNHRGEHLQAMLLYKNATLARYCTSNTDITCTPATWHTPQHWLVVFCYKNKKSSVNALSGYCVQKLNLMFPDMMTFGYISKLMWSVWWFISLGRRCIWQSCVLLVFLGACNSCVKLYTVVELLCVTHNSSLFVTTKGSKYE